MQSKLINHYFTYSTEFFLSILFKLSVSRSGYYMWKKNSSTIKLNCDKELYRYIFDILHEFKRVYGVVRIRKELLNRYGWLIINISEELCINITCFALT